MKEVPRSPERVTGYNPKRLPANNAPNPCLFLVPPALRRLRIRHCRGLRQKDRKHGSTVARIRSAGDAYPSAVLLYGAVSQPQSEAGAVVFLGRVERLEYVRQINGLDAIS